MHAAAPAADQFTGKIRKQNCPISGMLRTGNAALSQMGDDRAAGAKPRGAETPKTPAAPPELYPPPFSPAQMRLNMTSGSAT